MTVENTEARKIAERPQLYEMGWFEKLLRHLSWHTPEWLFRYNHGYLYTGDCEIPARRHKDVEIRFLTYDDIPRLAEYGWTDESTRSRLDRGDKCVVVLRGERIVTVDWASTSTLFIRESGCVFDTGNNGYLLYALRTVPEERLKGYFLACHKMHRDHFVAAGRPYACGFIEVWNDESRRIHERLGYSRVGETIYAKIFGIGICYHRSWPYRIKRFRFSFFGPPKGMKCE